MDLKMDCISKYLACVHQKRKVIYIWDGMKVSKGEWRCEGGVPLGNLMY